MQPSWKESSTAFSLCSVSISPPHSVIEGDSRIIVMMARKLQRDHRVDRITRNWRLEFRAERLAELLACRPSCSFSHVRRNGNRAADILANHGVTADNSFEVVKWPPVNRVDWMTKVERAADKDRECPSGIHPGLPARSPATSSQANDGNDARALFSRVPDAE